MVNIIQVGKHNLIFFPNVTVIKEQIIKQVDKSDISKSENASLIKTKQFIIIRNNI